MANDSVGVAAAGSPTNYIDNESITTGGSPATVDRQRVRVGGAGYADLADVVVGDTGQGASVVAGARKEVTFSTTTAQAVASTDCSNLRYVSVQITSTGTSATVNFQTSNDNATWVSTPLLPSTATASNGLTQTFSATAAGISVGPVAGRYFRLNVTGQTGGTTAGVVEFFAAPQLNAYPGTIAVAGPSGGAVGVTAGSNADNTSSPSLFTAGLAYNGAAWDRLRTATKFATATATASGDTAVATPAAGKKIRVLGYDITVTQDAATASGADVDILLRDATTALGYGFSCYCPAAAGTTFGPGAHTGWRLVGNGVLSAAANNVLNVNLSAALTAGKVRVNVAYTEE